MAPTEGPQSLAGIHARAVAVAISYTVTITSTVAIRLPTVDKDHIAGFQLIPFSLIDQLSLSILDHKTKVRLKFLTLAGVGFDRC